MNNDHPLTTASIFGSEGWQYYTGLTVQSNYRNDKPRLISLPISNHNCNSVCLKVGKNTQPTLWKVMPSDIWHQLSRNK